MAHWLIPTLVIASWCRVEFLFLERLPWLNPIKSEEFPFGFSPFGVSSDLPSTYNWISFFCCADSHWLYGSWPSVRCIGIIIIPDTDIVLVPDGLKDCVYIHTLVNETLPYKINRYFLHFQLYDRLFDDRIGGQDMWRKKTNKKTSFDGQLPPSNTSWRQVS